MSQYKTRVVAAACCAIAALAAPAIYAQSAPLAMSYGLDVKGEDVKPAPALVTRCTGFNWVAAVNACGRELLSRIANGETITRVVVSSSDAPPQGWQVMGVAPVESSSSYARQDAGEAPAAVGATGGAEARNVRSVAGRETLITSGRNADLSLRLGAQRRRGSDDGSAWDSRFVDATYQTHVQNNGHKALGVELLVPFQ